MVTAAVVVVVVVDADLVGKSLATKTTKSS